jgi:transketolase
MVMPQAAVKWMVKMNYNDIEEINLIKRNILQTAYDSQEGHVASSFSIVNILYILYKKVLKIDPHNLDNFDSDIFILSKGHASLALYAILQNIGFIGHDEMKSFCRFDNSLGGHPDRNKVKGVEASTGSLGHGFPMAAGIALGKKIQKKNKRIFVLVGDGELNEGTMWETMLLASHHKLNNLTCIIDYNHSTDKALGLGNLYDKLAAFGWATKSINGHNNDEIYEALIFHHSKPVAIIANTIKGYGCKMMENNPEWHHKSPNLEQLNIMMEELL